MTIIDLIFSITCVILGFVLCQLYYEVFEKDESTEPEFKELMLSENENDISELHFFDYDLSKQDCIITGDRHSDTIEKSFSKKEYWKYTFEDGKSENSGHPLSSEEMKPLVTVHGPVKEDGLEVIKL